MNTGPSIQTTASADPARTAFHRTIAETKPKAWRGIVALLLLFIGMAILSIVISVVGLLIDGLSGRSIPTDGSVVVTPITFASGMLALALLTPWSMLLQRWFFKLPPGSLSSLANRFRFERFGRAVAILVPVWAVYICLTSFLFPIVETTWTATDLVAVFGIILVLTPLQSMGEEYGFRGLVFQIASSWGRGPRSGLVIGILVSSVVFMIAHLAADPWLNLYYFVFGVTLALITWRTGGIEIAVAIHAVNNTIAFLLQIVLHADIAAGMDRSVGMGNAYVLITCSMVLGTGAVVWIATRRSGIITRPVHVSGLGAGVPTGTRPVPAVEHVAGTTQPAAFSPTSTTGATHHAAGQAVPGAPQNAAPHHSVPTDAPPASHRPDATGPQHGDTPPRDAPLR